MSKSWIVLVLWMFPIAMLLATGGSRAAQKPAGPERYYHECMTSDAEVNKMFLQVFHLKPGKLASFCHCQADIFRRYEFSTSLLTRLSEAPMTCARKLGGHM